MADAKIITFGELFSATTDVIQSNKIAALDIEDLGGESYIKINTTTGSEAILMGASDGIDDFAGLKVGIGTGTPVDKLHVAADDAQNAYVRFTNNTSEHTQADGCYVGIDSTTMMRLFNREATDLQIGTSNLVRVIVAANGNTGIGLPLTGTPGVWEIPQERLHVVNPGTGGSDNAFIKFTTGDTGHGASDGAHIGVSETGTFQIAMDDANDILLMQGAAPKLTVNSAGKVTIYDHAELRSSLSVANTFTQGTMGIGLGVGAYAEGDSTVAVGFNAHAKGDYSVAVGQYCDALGANSLAIGYDSVANDAHSIAIGFNNTCINPYSTSLGGAEWNSVKGAIRSELTIGLMETTDGTTTKLSTVSKKASGETSVDLTVYTSGTSTIVAGINKDYVMDLRISMTSVCTGAGGSFTVGEFVTREYVLSGVYIHSGTSFKVYSGSTEYTSGSANALRSDVRSNDAGAASGIAHVSNGIIDSFTLTESGGRGGIQISVDSQDTTAKVFHSARIWADSTLANYVA